MVPKLKKYGAARNDLKQLNRMKNQLTPDLQATIAQAQAQVPKK